MTRDAFIRYVGLAMDAGHPWHYGGQQLTTYKKGRSHYLTYHDGPLLQVYSTAPERRGEMLERRTGLDAVLEWERVTGLELFDQLGLEALL
jgi:hypothetical protein